MSTKEFLDVVEGRVEELELELKKTNLSYYTRKLIENTYVLNLKLKEILKR